MAAPERRGKFGPVEDGPEPVPASHRLAPRLVAGALWLLCGVALAGESFVGSSACGACHTAEFRRHAASLHARALRRAGDSHAPALWDRPVRERSGVELTYQSGGGGWQVEARQGAEGARAPLEWIFGAGALAFTPVGRQGATYFEHRVSWYAASQRLGMTLGHPPTPRASATEALGQPQSSETIYRCFHCHATAVKPGPDLSALQPGVQCERCHGPGAAHAAQPSGRNITKLTGLAARDSVAACGECHRMPPAGQFQAAPEKHDAMSIRFAPIGLMASRCYLASGTLTCTTCHDPHGDTRPQAVVAVERCQQCHAPATPVHSRCARPTNRDCLGCHMRKTTPVPDLPFTDHRIRVYAAAPTN